MNGALRAACRLTMAAILAEAWPSTAAAVSIFAHWEIAEFQPDIPNGGRANTFAVDPANASRIYVASESGGLFRSTNGGASWKHVDTFPCFSTMSVAFLPAAPGVMLVTTNDDFKAATGGGIWRSTDGGLNWTQATVTIPAGITTGRLSAYEISVAPDSGDVYVGSTYGVLKSTTQGASWTFQDVFAGGPVYSVVALGSDRVIAGGPSGIRRSDTGGASWLAPATGAGGISDLHGLGRSPLSSAQAFAVNGATALFHTEDAGQNWTQVGSAPAGGGSCGGIGFARAANRTRRIGTRIVRRLDLFFSNRCGVSRLRVVRNPATGAFDYSGTWQGLGSDHGDTRDIAFDNATNAAPILLGTDGGLHKTADGGATWTFTGGGAKGYNALQVTEVQGQLIRDVNQFDFYFGTQDNDLWSSGTDGASWTKGMCCEGFFIEAQKTVATAADSRVTNVACFGCGNFVSNPLFGGVAGWPNPPGNVAGNPVIVKRSQHVQGVDASGGLTPGLAVSDTLGASWNQFVAFPEERRSIPRLGRVGRVRPPRSTVLYQAYRAAGWAPGNFEINHLLRASRNTTATGVGTATYPAMNNFGGLGINPTMFAWYQVFAVDPGDHRHVIAPDVVNNRVMETRDGGDNWTEIPGLTALVTDGGRLRFSSSIFPIVSAISFSPQNRDIVAIGTFEGGVYVSADNGATWSRVAGSEGVTYATGFAWKSASDVVISTYGRGLWRLKSVLRIPRPDWETWCKPPCIIRIWPWEEVVDPLQPVEFDRGILVYDGEVLGARVVARVVREVTVSQGSSVVFAGDEKAPAEIKVVYASRPRTFVGTARRPVGPEGNRVMRGLVLDKSNRLAGAVFGDSPMTMAVDDESEDEEGSTKSPIEGRPYVRITARRFEGSPVAYPGEKLSITVGNLEADADVVVYVDDAPAAKGRAGRDGQLALEVAAPLAFGLHSVTIRRAADEKNVVDGTMFLVKHVDESGRKKSR
jgi:photosystem II stability/assembly factor-like uncharacterized protein